MARWTKRRRGAISVRGFPCWTCCNLPGGRYRVRIQNSFMYYAPAIPPRNHRAWCSKIRDCSSRLPHRHNSRRKHHTIHSKRLSCWSTMAISNPRFANCETMGLVPSPNAKDCPTMRCLITRRQRKNKSMKWPRCWHHWKPIQPKRLKNPKRPSHCILERMNISLERWAISHWSKGKPNHESRFF